MNGDAPCDNVSWKKVIRASGPFPLTVAMTSNEASIRKTDPALTIMVSSLDDLASHIFLTSVQVT